MQEKKKKQSREVSRWERKVIDRRHRIDDILDDVDVWVGRGDRGPRKYVMDFPSKMRAINTANELFQTLPESVTIEYRDNYVRKLNRDGSANRGRRRIELILQKEPQ